MRKLATWGFSFAAAVTVSEYLLTDKAKLTLAAAVLLLFFVNLFIKHGQRKRFSFILAGLCIGFVYTPLYSYLFIPQPEIRYGVLTEWEAEASDFPQTNKNGASLSVLIDAGGATQEAVIYVYDGSADGVKPGDRLRFTAKLYAVDGGADEESYFSRGDKVAASGAYDLEITRPAAGVTLRYFHKYAAKAIKDALKSVFPEKEYPLTLALITGDKSLLRSDRALTAALQRSGVYHVTTVSGMHVSILASFVLLLFGKRRGAGFILAPVLIAFAALAGFTPSVTRAVIMQLFVIAAPIFKREEDRLTSIAAALILIIAVDPSSAMSAGLQLSFAAILGISLFYGRIFGAITGFGRIEKIKSRRLRGVFVKLAGAASVTIGAQILTIPLSALHFGYISLAALPANMLITFAVSPAFILSAVSAGAGALYLPVGKAIAFVASLLLKCISWVAKLLSSSALSAVYVDNWVIIAWLILAYAAIIAFIIMRKEANRLILPLCASAAALALILVASAFRVDAGAGFRLTALDVGQGQCVVITSGPFTAVFDCGSVSNDLAGEECAAFINGLGRDSIDVLCISHYHTDHSNGAFQLIERLNVRSLVLPIPRQEEADTHSALVSAARRRGTEVIYVSEDVTADLAGTELAIFAPLGSETENEHCLTALVSRDGFEALITADISGSLERALADTKYLPDIECLVVSHHGSRYSSDEQFLKKVRPEIAIISVGYNNFGHPSEEALERLKEAGAEIYRTDIAGNISVNSKDCVVYG